jgi:8-oxo-dGTP pyrophosphatase MutT (NUDIX family)
MQDVKIVCRAFMRDDQNQLLLVRKCGATFWSLPGGTLEPNDASVQHCLVRELQEELGITAKVDDNLFVHEIHKGGVRYVELVWGASVVSGELPTPETIRQISGDELDDIRWASKKDLLQIDVKPERLRTSAGIS